jgi:GNAT superfamily N-acetyltransferase
MVHDRTWKSAMHEIDVSKHRQNLDPLFQEFPWNYLPEAILDGTLGHALADDAESPHVAALEAPSLHLSIVGGDSEHPAARAYLAARPTPSALLCAAKGWEELLWELHPGRVVRTQRYAFASEPLDLDRLRSLCLPVPAGYRVEPLDLDLARRLAGERSEFASDHLIAFAGTEEFLELGFGYCVLLGETIVAAATTFAVCRRGIEIQISTREAHQRRGLATLLAARLLVHSLELGLDPNWDAANRNSASLARKLGYTPQGTYPLFLLFGSRVMAIAARYGLAIKERLGK